MNREKIGAVLIILGVLVWPFGLFVMHWGVPNILALHLALVIPGAYLKGKGIFKRIFG